MVINLLAFAASTVVSTRAGWTSGSRPWRGRTAKQGIALALKAATILWAKGAGYTTVRTDNNSENHRMLEINDRLGFQRSAAILLMRTGGPPL